MYYEAFLEAKSADEEIVFVDTVHPEHNTMATYGWIKKDKSAAYKHQQRSPAFEFTWRYQY